MARSKMPLMDIVFAAALIALAMAAELAGAQAEGSAPAPGPATKDCTSTLINLSPCLDYILANDTTPPKDCCTGLAQVDNENKICLCQLFVKNNSFGFAINQTRAAAMPTLCKVQTPPLSTCTALGIPVSAPLSSNSGVSPSSPGVSPAGSAGNEIAPSSTHPASGTAGNFVPSVGLIAALVFAAFRI